MSNWIPIEGEPLYEINQQGEVRHTKKRGKPKKVYTNAKGRYVSLNNRIYYIDDLLKSGRI